jgi:hypothetical protein
MYKRFTREEKHGSRRARRSQNPTKAADKEETGSS